MPWVGVCGQFAGFQGFQGEKREYAFCRSSLRTGVASLMARFLQERANPCKERIIIRNEQVIHPRLLKWIYCNRTATGLIRTGTQWTNRLRQIIENRINRRKTGRTRTG
jgi:hypothetical protein